jgi:large conductance mechanosensitive channel
MFKEFRQFLLRGNVIDLAVGVVIGAAFNSVVSALVSDFMTPLIGSVRKVPDFNSWFFTVSGSKFMLGHFLNALISFLIVAATVFFLVVKPVNTLMTRTRKGQSQDPTTKKCPECLSDIPIDAKRCAHCTQPVK